MKTLENEALMRICRKDLTLSFSANQSFFCKSLHFISDYFYLLVGSLVNPSVFITGVIQLLPASNNIST
jgi:hypothetical protein